MLEKTIYHQLFSHSFSLPVEVTYWDGTTKQYGDTDNPPHKSKSRSMKRSRSKS